MLSKSYNNISLLNAASSRRRRYCCCNQSNPISSFVRRAPPFSAVCIGDGRSRGLWCVPLLLGLEGWDWRVGIGGLGLEGWMFVGRFGRGLGFDGLYEEGGGGVLGGWALSR